MTDQPITTDRLALLAHDLRTRLAAMELATTLIKNEPLTAFQSERVEILRGAIEALGAMTDELVRQDARAGADRADGLPSAAAILKGVAGLFQICANAKGLGFDADLAIECRDWAPKQPSHLDRAVAVLLDNAVKYTRKGKVSLSARCLPQGSMAEPTQNQAAVLEIVVADTGPGLPPGESSDVFRPFVRGSAGRAGVDGDGLGLWGASELIQEMGGQLDMTLPEAGGSRFCVMVPVFPAEGAGPPDLTDGARPSGDAHPLDADVLVVDDNETNLRLLSALLETFGVRVQQVSGGSAALAALNAERFDAVLLDLNMPDMDGRALAAKCQASQKLKDLPLIAVTAAHETADLAELNRLGIVDLVAKPLAPARLYAALARIFNHGGA